MPVNKPGPSLKIHPAPFTPSRLSIPPSPFSPRSPIQITIRTTKPVPQRPTTPEVSSPYPPLPLSWVWQCHQRMRSYALGVTRRCLNDGHFFCSGTTVAKNWRKSKNPRKVKRHRACGSEFDYHGWKAWGRWKRSTGQNSLSHDPAYASPSMSPGSHKSQTPCVKDCWNKCDYPSQCRWGRQFGIHTPATTKFPTITVTEKPPPPSEPAEEVLHLEDIENPQSGKEIDKSTFWDALLASATRRRSVPPSSPLAVSKESEQQTGPPKKQNSNTDMHTIKAGATAASGAVSAPATRVKNMIKRQTKRVKRSKTPNKKGPVRGATHASPTIVNSDSGRCEIEPLGELAPLSRMESSDSGYGSVASAV